MFFVCFFVRSTISQHPRADSRQILHAGVAWVSRRVFSSFGGWRPPAGGKRGKWNFRYYGSQWGIFAFWRFLSDISATLARIYTKYYLCMSVRPSVCLTHAIIKSKRLNILSNFIHHRIATRTILDFLYRTVWQYSDWNSLLGTSNTGGGVKIVISGQHIASSRKWYKREP